MTEKLAFFFFLNFQGSASAHGDATRGVALGVRGSAAWAVLESLLSQNALLSQILPRECIFAHSAPRHPRLLWCVEDSLSASRNFEDS